MSCQTSPETLCFYSFLCSKCWSSIAKNTASSCQHCHLIFSVKNWLTVQRKELSHMLYFQDWSDYKRVNTSHLSSYLKWYTTRMITAFSYSPLLLLLLQTICQDVWVKPGGLRLSTLICTHPLPRHGPFTGRTATPSWLICRSVCWSKETSSLWDLVRRPLLPSEESRSAFVQSHNTWTHSDTNVTNLKTWYSFRYYADF